MQDIFEFEGFFLWNFFEVNSFFIIFFFLILLFFFKFIFLYRKKTKKSYLKNDITLEKDFLYELKNIENDENFLEKSLSLLAEFLEKNTWIKNISNMSFKEFENLDLKQNYKDIFKEIYFKKYRLISLKNEEKQEIFDKLKKLFS